MSCTAGEAAGQEGDRAEFQVGTRNLSLAPFCQFLDKQQCPGLTLELVRMSGAEGSMQLIALVLGAKGVHSPKQEDSA